MAQPKSKSDREDRLSAQLRANLAKRKGQLRARNQSEVPDAPSDEKTLPDSPENRATPVNAATRND